MRWRCLSLPANENLITNLQYLRVVICVPAMLESGRCYYTPHKSRIEALLDGRITLFSLRDSRNGFDGFRSRYTPGSRVGPHMHARTAYHASSRDVTPGYNRGDSSGEERSERASEKKGPDEGRKKE